MLLWHDVVQVGGQYRHYFRIARKGDVEANTKLPPITGPETDDMGSNPKDFVAPNEQTGFLPLEACSAKDGRKMLGDEPI